MRSPRITRRDGVSCAPWSPARAAGLSGKTSAITTPSTPSWALYRSGTSVTPIPAWIARPRAMSCGTRRLIVSHGDGETDARRGTTRAEDRGVDADHSAARVEERPARAAGVDRGVGLDDVAEPAAIRRPELAPERAHDADGERVVEPERVADGEDALADEERARHARRERHELLLWRLDPEDREVLLGSDADDLRLPVGLVGERHGEGVAVLDDVEVGHDVALTVPHDTAPSSLRDLLDVEGEDVAPERDGRDEHDRRLRAAEDLDVPLLLRREPLGQGRRGHGVRPSCGGHVGQAVTGEEPQREHEDDAEQITALHHIPPHVRCYDLTSQPTTPPASTTMTGGSQRAARTTVAAAASAAVTQSCTAERARV